MRMVMSENGKLFKILRLLIFLLTITKLTEIRIVLLQEMVYGGANYYLISTSI